MAPKKLLTKKGLERPPQRRDPVQPHKRRLSLMDTVSEAIKGWSFLKERRVQLREGEYPEFQTEVARRQWTQLTKPVAKYDPEIVIEFYANTWPVIP